MQYVLLFHGNIVCTMVNKYNLIRTLPVLALCSTVFSDAHKNALNFVISNDVMSRIFFF